MVVVTGSHRDTVCCDVWMGLAVCVPLCVGGWCGCEGATGGGARAKKGGRGAGSRDFLQVCTAGG